jgi:hypothetical protein
MLYQLPNGKTIYLTIEQFLELSDNDIQYMISIDYGEYIPNPFTSSSVNQKEKAYDFDYLPNDDDFNNIAFEEPFDDTIEFLDF